MNAERRTKCVYFGDTCLAFVLVGFAPLLDAALAGRQLRAVAAGVAAVAALVDSDLLTALLVGASSSSSSSSSSPLANLSSLDSATKRPRLGAAAK